MIKIICAVLIGLVLSGCATQRPQMQESQYSAFSKAWATIHHCNRRGYLSAEDTARGRTYMTSTMNTYSFDPQKMDAMAHQSVRIGTNPSDDECRELAISIQKRKQQIENQNAQNAIQQRESERIINSSKSTQTYCNKIGTQVFCNSY